MAHTPTPWTYAAGGRYVREESTDGTIAMVLEDNGHADKRARIPYDAEANAAHIVRCVNSHDALVAALEECLIRIETDWPDERDSRGSSPRTPGIVRDAKDMARAALKLVKGE